MTGGRVGWVGAVGLADSGLRISWTGRGDGATGRAGAAGAGGAAVGAGGAEVDAVAAGAGAAVADPAVAAASGLAGADGRVSPWSTDAPGRGVGMFAAARTGWGLGAPVGAGLAGRGRAAGGLIISAGRLGGLAGAEAARAGAGAGRVGAAVAAGVAGATGRAGGSAESAPGVVTVSWFAFFKARMVLGAGAGVDPAPLPLVRISARMRPASSSLIELLWLRAGMERVSAASSTSLLSRPRSLDNS
jgi:hypothetical protein